MKKDLHQNLENAKMHFYLEADKEAIQQSLQDCIPDIEAYHKKRDQLVKRLRFLAKATSNKIKDNALLQVVADKFMDAINKNIDKPIRLLKNIMQGKAHPALNNNLRELSKEHLMEIIQDDNLVKLLEELEKDGTDY